MKKNEAGSFQGLTSRSVLQVFITAAVIFSYSALFCDEPACQLTAAADRTSALYKTGEPVTFTITASFASVSAAPVQAHFVVQQDGFSTVTNGEITFSPDKPVLTIACTFQKPSFLLLSVTALSKTILAGAGSEPEKIKPSMPKPSDFDAFWSAQKKICD